MDHSSLEYTQQLLLASLLDLCTHLKHEGVDTTRGSVCCFQGVSVDYAALHFMSSSQTKHSFLKVSSMLSLWCSVSVSRPTPRHTTTLCCSLAMQQPFFP